MLEVLPNSYASCQTDRGLFYIVAHQSLCSLLYYMPTQNIIELVDFMYLFILKSSGNTHSDHFGFHRLLFKEGLSWFEPIRESLTSGIKVKDIYLSSVKNFNSPVHLI